MTSLLGLVLKLAATLLLAIQLGVHCQFEWIVYDRIDEIMEKMNAVTADNCHQKQPSELQLIDDVVHQPPTINLLKTGIILANRTQLLHTRNVAHKNAILYSFQLLHRCPRPLERSLLLRGNHGAEEHMDGC